ncbi:MAG: glycosyltransferase family 2 protein [Melioribacter sp.]|uniref:glycosyltransferase family 2 protein n=1 Tax=Melioribacter sp. TaxID=2052167 RepID=UPI003BBD5A08
MKHVIITPVKNEENYIRFTIESIINQTELPIEWIIVDDGSTDKTVFIVKEFLKRYNWIKLIRLNTKDEKRKGGSKVVNAFYEGYKRLENTDWDFISKIDGDLTLPNNYFEIIFNEFKNEKNLGICGGTIFQKNDKGELVEEKVHNYFVRGALKTISRDCWQEISGFKKIWFWDSLDLMEAHYNGFTTKSINIPVIHHRKTSSAYNPVWHSFKSGYESFKMRYSFLLVFIRTVTTLKKRPFIVCSFFYFAGFVFALIKLEKRLIPKDLSTFINLFHYKVIISKLKKIFR